jgi:hypothetical protein
VLLTGACGLIFLIVNPWSLRVGSRWTPTFIWHGYGKLQSTTGADYLLCLRLMPHMNVSESSSDTSNLSGSAALCTPQRTIHDFEVDGTVKAWLNADRKQMRLALSTPDGIKPSLAFRLNGDWEGQELILQDSGSLAESFHEDGTAKGYLAGSERERHG